ncbi:MAG: AAA family ATPase, partial [Candidatus Helarchaeota archaeon]
KALKIMALTEIINPKLVLIDDFVVGFHPSMVRMLVNWLKDKKWQTVISTHSIDVLGELADIDSMDANILQLKKTSEDVLKYNLLTFEKFKSYMDANNDPRLLIDAI